MSNTESQGLSSRDELLPSPPVAETLPPVVEEASGGCGCGNEE